MAAETNGKKQKAADPTINRRVDEFVGNAMSMTRDFLRQMIDPRRDYDAECGYPTAVNAFFYSKLFDEEPIANRVVEVLPKETWQVTPTVYESEDSDDATAFEEAWDNLSRGLLGEESWYQDESGSPIWEWLLRADIMSGIGQYAILLLGLDDGADLATEAKPKDGRKLTFLRVFPESLAPIASYETDQKSPRLGKPLTYLVTFNDPREQQYGIGVSSVTRTVHWSRVIHIADNLTSSETFGVPRMRPVLKRIIDLIKLYGGSAEMYWKGAFPGLSIETHPQLATDDVGTTDAALKDMIDDYQNGLSRALGLFGMTAKTLAPTVSDPTSQINVQIEAICIKLAIPVPVFKGYEIGEQASTENRTQWNRRLKLRQQLHATPRIVVPLVDRLISLGCLPKPETDVKTTVEKAKDEGKLVKNVKGPTGKVIGWKVYNAESEEKATKAKVVTASGYSIEWPDIGGLSDAEKASVALTKTQALTAFIGGNGEAAMTLLDFYVEVWGMDEARAVQIIENAEQAMVDKEAEELEKQQEQIAAGVIPDPTDPAQQLPPPGGNPFAKGGPPQQGGKPGGGGFPPKGGAGGKPNPFVKNEASNLGMSAFDALVCNAIMQHAVENWDSDQLRDELGRWAGMAGGAAKAIGQGIRDIIKDDNTADDRTDRHVTSQGFKDRVKKAWAGLSKRLGMGVSEAFSTTPEDDGIPVAVELDPEIDRKTAEVRQKAANHSIGEVTKAFERFGIARTQTFNNDVSKNPVVRADAVNDPSRFDRSLNKAEDHLNVALHLSTDPEQRGLLTRKLDEVQELRTQVNRFRERHQPEVRPSTYTPSVGVPRRPEDVARESHARTADVAKVAETVRTPAPGTEPTPIPTPSTGGRVAGSNPNSGHRGRQGAAAINTVAAMEHLSTGGTPATAVAHVMEYGGVSASTAQRYVKAAIKAASVMNQQRIRTLRREARSA